MSFGGPPSPTSRSLLPDKSFKSLANATSSTLSRLARRVSGHSGNITAFNDPDKVKKNNFNPRTILKSCYSTIHSFILPGIPEHYPLRKKLILAKSKSYTGVVWEISQVVMALITCVIYVMETYFATYQAVHMYKTLDMVITQFFLVDFVYNIITANSYRHFLSNAMTWVDVITIAPLYITVALETATKTASVLFFFRFIRIFRMARVLRVLRYHLMLITLSYFLSDTFLLFIKS